MFHVLPHLQRRALVTLTGDLFARLIRKFQKNFFWNPWWDLFGFSFYAIVMALQVDPPTSQYIQVLVTSATSKLTAQRYLIAPGKNVKWLGISGYISNDSDIPLVPDFLRSCPLPLHILALPPSLVHYLLLVILMRLALMALKKLVLLFGNDDTLHSKKVWILKGHLRERLSK